MIEHRPRRYKWKYQFYRRMAYAALALVAILAVALFYALRGNHALQRRLDASKIITIMPNGQRVDL